VLIEEAVFHERTAGRESLELGQRHADDGLDDMLFERGHIRRERRPRRLERHGSVKAMPRSELRHVPHQVHGLCRVTKELRPLSSSARSRSANRSGSPDVDVAPTL
jgi:hypothetical protein